MAALIASLAAVLACPQSELPPPPDRPSLREDLPFDSSTELVRAIEQGTFVERAGLREQIEEVTRPPEPPPPVKIEFVSGTDVPADQQDELRELAERLKADEQLKVDLIGCSDPPGAAALNQRISESRARAVEARLRELGVGDGQIAEVIGRGEECREQERAVNAVLRYPSDDADPAGTGDAETPAEG